MHSPSLPRPLPQQRRRGVPLLLAAVMFSVAMLTAYGVVSGLTFGVANAPDDDTSLGATAPPSAAPRSEEKATSADCDCDASKTAVALPLTTRPPLIADQLTVVLMSYPGSSRFHLLKKIIERALSWHFVYEVLLVWNGEEGRIPPDVRAMCDGGVEHGTVPSDGDAAAASVATSPSRSPPTRRPEGTAPRVTVLPQQLNRIDNRWRIGSRVRTEAILNMDDDIDLRTDGAQCLFDVWQSSPHALVGIDVRSHFIHKEKSGVEEGPFGPYGYAARDTSTRGVKKFSITLPRSLLTSRDHLLSYDAAWRDPSTRVKAIVDELLCDDIAFNFVANAHHSVPLSIYAKANYGSYPESNSAGAMVKMPGMKAKRQRCVNELSAALNLTLKHRYWHVLCSVDG